jgi:hypothetical protein
MASRSQHPCGPQPSAAAKALVHPCATRCGKSTTVLPSLCMPFRFRFHESLGPSSEPLHERCCSSLEPRLADGAVEDLEEEVFATLL